jgi:putative hemolysin
VSEIFASIALVLVFIMIGGFFAASELALISLREAQVDALRTQGKRGQRVARLHADPNRFLAAVQVGVTLAGFLSAAFGAETLAGDLSDWLVTIGLSAGVANVVALVGITVVIAYVSLVIGELVPKRIALQHAEGIALAVAGTVDRVARLARPMIWILSVSTNAVVRLLGSDPQQQRESISSEELRMMISTHADLSHEERQIVEDVFDARARTVREVMVPRTEVMFLDASMSVLEAATTVSVMPHSRYPVTRGSSDDVIGFVHVRDLVQPVLAGRTTRVGALARPVLMLPGSKGVLPTMSEMRRTSNHLAIVVDEYGGTNGIVTLEDLVEELVGDIRDEYDDRTLTSRELVGGDLEVDGLLNLDEFNDRTGLELPDGPYETVAGYVVNALGRLPRVGDEVEVGGRTLRVLLLDGRRVERLRVSAPVLASSDGEDDDASTDSGEGGTPSTQG